MGWNGQLAVHPFGKLDLGGERYDVDEDSMYDVASLTKPIVTTTAAMLLAQQGKLDLDRSIENYLPDFAVAAKSDPDPSWRGRITPRMLLLHDSGLPDHREYFKAAKGRNAILNRVLAEPLINEPGKHIVYSDLGFILLGEIIQRLTGNSLDEFAKHEIFEPLGMDRSMFNPPRKLREDIAPTEKDTTFRKRQVWGEVHDENAWAMGGVAGHAGLFSTADDIAAFAQMLINGGIYGHERVLSRSTIQLFTAHHSIGSSTRTLGWDVPEDGGSSGHYFSPSSFGHLGFTGTSLWIDPERKLFVILLTNRVDPTRANEEIKQVRPTLHDAVMEGLGLAAAKPAAAR